jgi:glutamine cyclotransferase
MKIKGNIKVICVLGILFSITISLTAKQSAVADKPTEIIRYKVVREYPHDKTAFTEGLFYRDGFLYESTGGKGKSTLRKVEIKTGKVLKGVNVPEKYFAEGITLMENRIYQLTWKERRGFIYDANSMEEEGRFSYNSEGWGLTSDGNYLIMSDGSSSLYFLKPGPMRRVRHIKVHDGNGPVKKLNELEFIKGYIYANVWMTDTIVKISPDTGEVVGQIDLSELLKNGRPEDKEAVLNGIAYDEKGDRVFVTGKLWPKLFEIKLETK